MNLHNRTSSNAASFRPSSPVTRAARAAVEALEGRQLFSTITWTNEGSAGSDTDSFDAVYGDDAETARDCVRAAISAWERVIVDFNRPGGSNTFDLQLTAAHIDDADALGHTSDIEFEDCRPVSAVIVLDDDAVGDEWFFDPTPMSREEFTTIHDVSAAAGDLNSDPDLYSVVLHELGHALGITGNGGAMIWDVLSDTGVTDPDDPEGEELVTLNGFPQHVLTAAGGLHVWAGENAAPGYVGHEFDLMTTHIDNDEIRTISSFDAYVLAAGYGYTVQEPMTLPDQQFMAVINPTSRVLTINGNCNPSVLDNITLLRDGDDLLVTSGWDTVRLPLADFDSIDFAAAVLSGDSTKLTLDMSGGDMIPLIGGLTFDGDAGDDVLNVDLRNGGALPAGPVAFEGNGGVDELHVYGQSAAANAFVVNKTAIGHDGTSALSTGEMTVESVVVEGGDKDDAIAVNLPPNAASAEFRVLGNDGDDDVVVGHSSSLFTTNVEGGKGDDTLTLVNVYHNLAGIVGDVHFAGNDGLDRLFVDNSSNTAEVAYTLEATSVDLPFMSSTITHFSTEERTLEAGNGKNTVNVVSIAQFTTTFVNAADGDDTIVIDSLADANAGNANEIRGAVVLDGGLGDNALLIHDAGDTSGDLCTITDSSIGADPSDTFFGYTGSLEYANLKTIDIYGAQGTSGGANSFAILSTSADTDRLTVTGGSGNDAFIVGGTYAKYTAGSVDGVRSQVLLKGGKGDDTLKIDDTADASGDIITVTHDRVGAHASDTFFGNGGSVEYDSVSHLTLYAGGGGNTVYVVATNANTPTFINSGLGNDQVVVDANRDAAGGTVDTIVSALTVDGSAGNDQLFLQDASDTTADHATITGNSVGIGAGDSFFGPGGTLKYYAIDTLTLNAGSGADDVSVLGTKSATQTVINGNDGVDKVSLGSLSVDTIFSEVIVDGGAGDDLLIANDSTDNTNDILTLTATQLGAAVGDAFFGAGGKLTYYSMKTLSVLTGSGADTVHVQRTAPGTDVNFTTGLGADAINVGWNGRVSDIRSKVTIDAQSDSDTLTFNDSATTDPRTVSVLTDRVGFGADNFFGNGGFVQFASIDAMTLNAGTSHDTINVCAVNLGKTLTVNAGAGNDTVNVDSNGTLSGGTANDIKGALTVHGGTGVNTVSVNDTAEIAATTVTVTPMGATSGFIDQMPGDNLFGAAAASLSYTGVNVLYLYTGTAADTIKLTPAATPAGTKFFVRAGLGGGDVLDLETAGLFSPVLIANPDGTGKLTSANKAPVEWTSVETVM